MTVKYSSYKKINFCVLLLNYKEMFMSVQIVIFNFRCRLDITPLYNGRIESELKVG